MIASTPWEMLRELPGWQITHIPRWPLAREGGHARDDHDTGIAQRFQALAASYCRASPVAMAWIRERPGGPVRVLICGPALIGGRDGEHAVLTVPAGARGSPLPSGEAAGVLAGLPCWTELAGISDVLLTHDAEPGSTGDRDRVTPPSLEDGLLSAWSEPFGWLLVAEPAGRDMLGELTSSAARAQLAAQQNDTPRSKLAVRRASARHDELRRAAATGLWRLHVLAGGSTPQEAAHVAGLFCASADLTGLPYALIPSPGVGSLPAILTGDTRPYLVRSQDAAPRDGSRSSDADLRLALRAPAVAAHLADPNGEQDTPKPQAPFWASTRLLAALARAPAREVPGLRFTLRPDFDVTPETNHAIAQSVSAETPCAIALGQVLDRNRRSSGPLTLSWTSLNRHVFVAGATGAGKSQTIRGLLEAATGAGVPWLVIEPAKAEYRFMAARLPGTEVIRIRPGDLDDPPAGLNPLEPASGPDDTRFPLQTHADLVRALFLAAFQADEPFPQVLAAALTRCYEQAGWDMVTGQPAVSGTRPAYPALDDLQAAALQVIADIGYGREVTDNVRGFVTVRIASLQHGTAGRFLGSGHRLDFGALLDRAVVLEIEDAGDDRDKAFLMGTVLIRLTEHLRLRARAEGTVAAGLRHLTVIEEAHRLLRQPAPGTGNGPAAQAVEMFADLLAEVRAYGEGLIIAEQIPSKLIPDVIKNTAVKIVHRLPAHDDRDTVGATMNLTPDQSQYLVTLPPGEAAVHADGMDYPLLVRMPDGTSTETTRPATTVPPIEVITVRSPSCDSACRKNPCTLRQIRAAQQAAAHDPAITLWTELAVLGALTGWPPPVPGPELTSRLLDLPERVLGCALSHGVDAAVSARPGAHPDPAALAVHATGMLRDFVGGRPFPAPQPQWLAEAFRWNLVVTALATGARTAGWDAPPHPDTSAWAEQYEHAIPGETLGEQYAAARARKQAAWTRLPSAKRRALIFGTRTPSAIETTVGVRAGTAQWLPQLTTMLLREFADGSWALDWLAPSRPAVVVSGGG